MALKDDNLDWHIPNAQSNLRKQLGQSHIFFLFS